MFFLLFFLFTAAPHCSLDAEEPPFPLPVITRLDSRDTAFRQYLEDVETSRRALFSFRNSAPDRAAAERIVSSLTIYSYIPEEEDLLSIAARCNIPYATLASLNRFSHGEDMVPGKALLLPSVPGIFIPEKPATDLERLLFSARAGDSGDTRYAGAEDSGVLVSVPREGSRERFRFVPGDDFNSVERIFFLNRGFRFPLERFEVSSPYGPRVNPITGKPGMHGGLDLAAPRGTAVYAVKEGKVTAVGEDPVLGKYVIVSHGNDWISFYGHLSEIDTVLHAELQSTNLIGRVGSTGQSTGPHLHFELRQNGRTRDPARLLGIFGGTKGQ